MIEGKSELKYATREELIEFLESCCVACYDEDTTDELRDCAYEMYEDEEDDEI